MPDIQHVDPALCQEGFEITGQQTPRSLMALQDGVHVGEAQPPHSERGVLAWAEFPNGWHRLSHPGRVPSAWAGPCPLVDLLDMVAEMEVVGSAQNDHVLRGW